MHSRVLLKPHAVFCMADTVHATVKETCRITVSAKKCAGKKMRDFFKSALVAVFHQNRLNLYNEPLLCLL
jgi:hypothetical protein